MKKNRKIVVTLAFLLVAVLIFCGTAAYSYGQKRDECFDRLVGYTGQVAAQIRDKMSEDGEYLESVSEQLSKYDLTDTAFIARELSTRGDFGILSELEILLPGDRLMSADGTIGDAPAVLSFDALKNEADFITTRTSDEDNPERQIIRHCVPIVQGGEPVAVLCGVIDLADMPDFFYIYDYGNDFNVFVVEAKSGLYIQDTWHDTLASTAEFGDRKVMPGYDMAEFDRSIQAMQPDTVVFLSASAGEYFYMYAAPVGVADWMVLVNVLESVVFSEANALMVLISAAAVLLVLVFAAYFVWMLRDMHRENASKEKQIRNVSYMLAVEKLLFDAHIHPEHFTQALACVAEYLSAEASFLWLTTDDWALEQRCWCAGRALLGAECENFRVRYPGVYERLEQDGEVSIGSKKELLSAFGAEGKRLAEMRIHSLLAIPVRDANDRIIFVLGVCNFQNRRESKAALQQVALSFSMTISHYEAYHALQAMGTTDAMTGVLNRNSYDEAVDAMATEKPAAVGCVYIDVNGLHEVNNYLGHRAGDEMLRTIADTLKKWFPEGVVYRIGGDEFVVLAENTPAEKVHTAMQSAREELTKLGYALSVGIVCADGEYNINKVIEIAEQEMRRDKATFYSSGGRERSLRQLNEQMEHMISEKRDIEAFLAVLKPEFSGVYFVNLDTDEVWQLFAEDYVDELLETAGGSYHKVLLAYARAYVVDSDLESFEKAADFEWLKEQLDGGEYDGFAYTKKDGAHRRLQISKMAEDGDNRYKTQWIFRKLP